MTCLENRFLPMLEVNAAYSEARIGQPLEQPIWICPSRLDQRQLEGSVVEGNGLERTGHERSSLEGFGLAGTLVALEIQITPITSSIWVEQVAWTQAPLLSEVWCNHVDAGDWRDIVAREIARTLERDAGLLAYLAYEGDDTVGMMIASSDGICGWWAGTDDVAQALCARGASDLGRLAVSVPRDRCDAFPKSRETARFEIFVTGNSDRRSLEASR